MNHIFCLSNCSVVGVMIMSNYFLFSIYMVYINTILKCQGSFLFGNPNHPVIYQSRQLFKASQLFSWAQIGIQRYLIHVSIFYVIT